MFLGLILAGTMMSFTNLDTQRSVETVDDLCSCCTAINSSGLKVTKCSDLGPDVACPLAEAALAILELQQM